MKFKSFINSDIEDFRKLNIGIVKNSKEELVRKIQEKYGIDGSIIETINKLNILLDKKTKIGFAFETDSIEKKIKKLNKKKMDIIKIKILESNSFLAEMKKELEKKLAKEENK